ncbi:MAG: hypothetical protein DWQ01_22665 [Planctomycetota bacterium]|nr:MAG: hypothetical protein DWQ01_22665 [Planctomycetota bacterium]
MEFTRVWLPYLYLYGVGGVLFLIGLVMAVRSPGFQAKRRSDRRWFRLLIFGFVWYAAIHGLGILAALEGAA